MSGRLEVRDLWVLFSGPPQPSPMDGSVRVLLVDRDTESMLRAVPGARLGLCQVAFTVEPGECLAVLGASGAGKSSLLRTLAGLQPAGRGRVLVNDRDVSTMPPEARGIVYLHQEPVLFPHLSMLENVAFPLRVRGVTRQEAEQRAYALLTRLGVPVVAGNAATALSGGQRHRVALARALCADPAVLLLDEPLSSLDPAIRTDVRAALLEARRLSGAATVLVTHDLDDAMAVATHVTTISEFGTLTDPMSTATILDAPPSLAAARLLGVFAEVTGVVLSGRFLWIGGAVAAPGMPDGPAVACLRAHAVQVTSPDAAGGDPVLTVTGRRDAAHDVQLTLCDAAGATATVRTGSGTTADVGASVQVTCHRATFFRTD